MMLLPPSGAEGPWIEVTSPDDGDWVTNPDLTVEGNAVPPTIIDVLGGEYIVNGTGFGFVRDGTTIRMSPREMFSDDFSGMTLDTEKWQVIRYPAGITFENGHLKLANSPNAGNFPMVTSMGASFPSNVDWTARFQMQMMDLGYSGSGGGISRLSTSAESSHLAGYNLWVGWGQPSYKVYSNGQDMESDASVGVDHLYTLAYDSNGNRFTTLLDGEQLDTFVSTAMPNIFWFGSSALGLYQFYADLEIDEVDVWAHNGVRTFGVTEFPYTTMIDRLDADWTSTDRSEADVVMEARISADNQSWSEWVHVVDGVPSEDLEGRFLQVRLRASLKGVRDPSANIIVSGIQVHRHHPVTSVEVRNMDTDGAWLNASGLEAWNAVVPLREDLNTIQVRITDASGASNVTSFDQLLDTTPPTGNVHILKDRAYTSNLNVTLNLNATDKYDVAYVEVSNMMDMEVSVRFPYKRSLDWRLGGGEGLVGCFVRFIDTHGLTGEIVSDSIVFDITPPSGEISIAGGKDYTPSLRVDLDLTYYDAWSIGMLELSNQANFTDARSIPVGDQMYEHWMLTDGGDGPRTLYFRLTDQAGNSRVVSDTVEYRRPTALGGLTIEEGANITRKPAVQIEIDLPQEIRPRMMQLSNDAAFLDSEWEPAKETVMWVLSPDDGPKIVFLRFIDIHDIVSLPVNASIVLDTTPPQITLLLDGGAMYTIDRDVEVTIEYRDASPAFSMWVSRIDRFNDVEEEPFRSPFPWTVPSREGEHNIYIKVTDLAGNEVVVQGSIQFASIIPILNVTLPHGPVTGSRENVTVAVEVDDPYGGVEYALAIDADPLEDVTWLPEGSTFQVPIPESASDGDHRVMARARNAPGLVSELAFVDFKLDWTEPSVTIVAPVDGAVIPQSGLDILLKLSAQDPSGISSVRYRLDGMEWVTVKDGNLDTVITMDQFGDHCVDVEVTDGVGNPTVVGTSFRVEDSEAQVGTGGSWFLLLVLVAIVIVVGLGYGVHKHRLGGTLLGFLGHGKHQRTEVGPGSGSTEVATDSAAAEEAPGIEDDVETSDGNGTVHVDEQGVEWEQA